MLSVTTTNDGLFDEALIRPQEPFSKINLTPLIFKISLMTLPAILVFFSNFISKREKISKKIIYDFCITLKK